MSLFRSQVQTAVANDLGTALHWSPPRHRLVVLSLLCVVVVGVSGILLLPYAEKIAVRGVVQAPIKPPLVVAGVSGRLQSFLVDPEAHVKQGAVVARIDLRKFVDGGKSVTGLEIDALQHKLSRIQAHQQAYADVTDAKLNELELEMQRLAAAEELFRERTRVGQEQAALADSTHTRMTQLQQGRWIGSVEASRSLAALLDVRQRQLGYTMELADIQRNQINLLAQQRTLKSRHKIENLEYEDRVADLRMRIHRARLQSVVAIVAPQDGVVADLFVQPGDVVEPHTPLLTMQSPSVLRRVELYIPGHGAGRVVVGQAVKLRFDSFPHQEFGFGEGVVSRVSTVRQPVDQNHVYLAAIEMPDLPPRIPHLAPGTAVSADIVLSRKPVWRRLTEPLAEAVARI